MLVVTRRKGQRIVIGNDIEVVVSGISGSTVKLAIVAPRNIPVLRGEVFEAVCQLNQSALTAEVDLDFEVTSLHIEPESKPLEDEGPNVIVPTEPSVTALTESEL